MFYTTKFKKKKIYTSGQCTKLYNITIKEANKILFFNARSVPALTMVTLSF